MLKKKLVQSAGVTAFEVFLHAYRQFQLTYPARILLSSLGFSSDSCIAFHRTATCVQDSHCGFLASAFSELKSQALDNSGDRFSAHLSR
jgi:hypothetical protein